MQGAILLFTIYFSGWYWFKFILDRTMWVHRFQFEVLKQSLEVYDRLPSTNSMIWRVWIWDPTKFLPIPPKGNDGD